MPATSSRPLPLIFIAHLHHTPEDTAIGLGFSPDEAKAALVRAFPGAAGKELEVRSCAVGEGLASL